MATDRPAAVVINASEIPPDNRDATPVPSMLITGSSFLLYCATVDLLTYEMFGRLLLPNPEWVLLIFGLAPTVALAGIGLTVMISARVKGFREAQQISALLVVPILIMFFAQASGVMIFGYLMVGALTLVFILVDILLFRLAVKIFQREKLLSQ